MAELGELKLSTQLFLRAYPWRRIEPIPFSVPRRPLAESRVALVSSAGMVLPDQLPFDERVRGGDWSWRPIPADTAVETLRETHRSESFDHQGIHADANLAFPLERLRELAAEGAIGAVAPRHASIMGSLTAPGRLIARTAPEIADLLVGDQVDVALLVPV